MTAKEKFLQEMRSCITASQSPKLVGVARFDETITDVYLFHLGKAPEKPVSGPMARGRDMETIVLDYYEFGDEERKIEPILSKGEVLVRQPPMRGPYHIDAAYHKGLHRFSERPDVASLEVDGFSQNELKNASWFGCHPDALVVDKVTNKIKRLIEIKTVGAAFDLEAKGIYPDWIIQCQHGMAATGAEETDLVVFNCESHTWEPIPLVKIVADHEVQRALLCVARKFWFDHVQKQIPPPAVIQNDTIRQKFPEIEDDSVEIKDKALIEKIEEAHSLQQNATMFDKQYKILKNSIHEALHIDTVTSKHLHTPTCTITVVDKKGNLTLKKEGKNAMIADGIDPSKYLSLGAPIRYISIKGRGGQGDDD